MTSADNSRPVRLTFDTADRPLPAGVERRQVTSRHQLYQTEDLCLDLLIERQPATHRSTLVGQVADAREPLRALADVPVALRSGDELLAESVTDPLGEFRLEYEPRRPMRLCFELAAGQVVELPIDRRATKRPPAQ